MTITTESLDMEAALTRRVESTVGDARALLREADIRHAGVSRDAQTVEIRFRDAATRAAARALLGERARTDWDGIAIVAIVVAAVALAAWLL